MRLEDFDRIYETCESQVRSELITTPSNLNDTTLLMCLDPTQPDPPKTENFVTQPDAWLDPTYVQL